VKVCDNCNELVAISAKVCDACGHAFPPPEEKKFKLHQDDIMGLSAIEMPVKSWRWRRHVSRTSGKEMLAVSYYGGLSDPIVTEYFPILHDGYAGTKARKELGIMAEEAGVAFAGLNDLDDLAKAFYEGILPNNIKFKVDGKFYRVLQRTWEDATAEAN
jgi:DNA repair protein RadD